MQWGDMCTNHCDANQCGDAMHFGNNSCCVRRSTRCGSKNVGRASVSCMIVTANFNHAYRNSETEKV